MFSCLVDDGLFVDWIIGSLVYWIIGLLDKWVIR